MPRNREDRRERERRYEADVDYEVWRSGGDVDVVDRERVRTYFDDGTDSDSAAHAELRRQRPNRNDGWAEEQQQQEQEQFPAEPFPDDPERDFDWNDADESEASE